jgi:hypothetical protein
MFLKTLNTPFFLFRSSFATLLLVFVFVSKSFAQDTTALLIIKSVPIVIGSINDSPAYFLIDTGASITMLNESQAQTYGFEVVSNKFFAKGRIAGMGGRSFLKEARGVRIKLGIHELNFINKAANFDSISAMFADDDIIIAGIIGADLLYILGSRIDLGLGIIVFKPNKPANRLDLSCK